MQDRTYEAAIRTPSQAGCNCGCGSEQVLNPAVTDDSTSLKKAKLLNVDLLAIDLTTCERCVPTGDTLAKALRLLKPVAAAIGIELRENRVVVRNPEEAKALALITSPTIRLNGRDIVQDVHESECESCGDLVGGDSKVDCREWHYKGQVFTSVPLPMLIETMLGAMLKIDEVPPMKPAPLEELPDNLSQYFASKKLPPTGACCCY